MTGFFKDVLDGKVRDVRKWLENGQTVGEYDEYGNTALHLASERGYRGVCKVLIDAGADVNQKNSSVGWSAVHYAAYEGHGDVLRMLIAHGAVPDALDNSGDTAESYAKEWENVECLTILQEAVAMRDARYKQTHDASKSSSGEMFDSDDKTLSDESEDEDEDESSMMNWVIPLPSQSSNTLVVNQTHLVNNLVNNQFSKTVSNLTTNLESEKECTSNQKIVRVQNKDDKMRDDTEREEKTREILDNEKNSISEIERKKEEVFVRKATSVETTPNNDESEDKSLSLTSVSRFDDEDTESEDTLKLIEKSCGVIITRETTPSKLRPNSIVDRIKNSLSPAPTPNIERKAKVFVNENGQPDIDKLLDFSLGDKDYKQSARKMQKIQEENSHDQECVKSHVKESGTTDNELEKPENSSRARSQRRESPRSKDENAKENDIQNRRERSIVRALSQAREIIARERSATRAASQARDQVCPVREMTIPRDLGPLADHIFSMSSATIPDDMTMSCGSIFERFGDLEAGESEKDILLKRLKEIIDDEGLQIKQDLDIRKKQLEEVEVDQASKLNKLKSSHKLEEDEMRQRHIKETETMQVRHSGEVQRIKQEIKKLEEELENIIAPCELLSNLTTTSRSSSLAKITPTKPGLSELEQELTCCGCSLVCRPPSKIYQCSEGDLICEICRKTLETCPECQMKLAGGLSRNKVLENIARKYFADK